MKRTYKSGFTLVEILIVVIILGILAAIVIPQFTNASQDARRSSLSSQLQTLRSQIELYKLQHKDRLPNLGGTGTNEGWDLLTEKTDAEGVIGTTPNVHIFGPYLQAPPVNPLMSQNQTVVLNGDWDGNVPTTADGSAAYLYDYGTNGDGSGKIIAVEQTGATTFAIFQE